MGATTLVSIQCTGSGSNFFFGQAYEPGQHWPRFVQREYTGRNANSLINREFTGNPAKSLILLGPGCTVVQCCTRIWIRLGSFVHGMFAGCHTDAAIILDNQYNKLSAW
jgi:hypothetical protein